MCFRCPYSLAVTDNYNSRNPFGSPEITLFLACDCAEIYFHSCIAITPNDRHTATSTLYPLHNRSLRAVSSAKIVHMYLQTLRFVSANTDVG
jgi:hypothetical protein